MLKIGLIEENTAKVYGAQATGCSPITTAVKSGWDLFRPQRTNTICKSLAIGNPADGFYAAGVMRESGGWGEDVSDEEIVDAMKLLASTEGIFAETAGGVTLGVAKKLIEQDRIPRDESIVLCITGTGLKTQEVLQGKCGEPMVIDAKMGDFDTLYSEIAKSAKMPRP
jgi:threonine synthase